MPSDWPNVSEEPLELRPGAQPSLDEKGHLPLHYLAMKQDVARLVRYVEEKGHNPNGVDHQDNTPLHWAVWNRRFASSQALLALGADPNRRNHKGDTVLHHTIARVAPQATADQVRLLLKHGADPLKPNHAGNTVFHALAQSSFRDKDNMLELAELLEASRPGLGWRTLNHYGQTPLDVALDESKTHWMGAFAAAGEQSLLNTTTAPVTAAPRGGPSRRL